MSTIKKLLFFITLAMFIYPVYAESDTDIVAEGGRLYDKWWEEYDLKKPSLTHPSYPARGQKKGADTWRCKECHGWDYKGVQGAYGKGSHYTGIRGISRYAGKPESKILAILKNATHRFDDVMLDYGLLRIARFVSKGQVDISAKIDKNRKVIGGDLRRGKQIFNDSCKECHGRDGRERNFKDRHNPEYIGTVANKNPLEVMHKIRNGQPGAFVMGDSMPHMNGDLSLREQLDLLAYMQSLPVK